jgi:hypothetical protein
VGKEVIRGWQSIGPFEGQSSSYTESIQLDPAESQAFVVALLEEPRMNESLLAAFDHRRRLVASD